MPKPEATPPFDPSAEPHKKFAEAASELIKAILASDRPTRYAEAQIVCGVMQQVQTAAQNLSFERAMIAQQYAHYNGGNVGPRVAMGNGILVDRALNNAAIMPMGDNQGVRDAEAVANDLRQGEIDARRAELASAEATELANLQQALAETHRTDRMTQAAPIRIRIETLVNNLEARNGVVSAELLRRHRAEAEGADGGGRRADDPAGQPPVADGAGGDRAAPVGGEPLVGQVAAQA